MVLGPFAETKGPRRAGTKASFIKSSPLLTTGYHEKFWGPLKTVLFRDCGVSLVLTAFGAHKHGALRTVRPYVFAYKLRFSARDFLALTKKSWFLEVPFI